MSEHSTGRALNDPAGAPRQGSDSHLRLVRVEEGIVLPEQAQPTDEAPTIISKNSPAQTMPPSTPESRADGLRGKKLAHFELIAPIGVGGMAAVLRARDTQLDRIVALKILPPEMAADEENVRRFHQEARAAAKLDHENIARVFFCGEDQRLHFIAFEFVEGDNLRSILEGRRRLPVGEAMRYILQIAAGLEHAASRGVVHRDIKPSNIIIGPTGRAKLVDMGLARSLEPRGEQDLTQSGVTLGTFDYISPEQALEPREADTRSDIYSLGCTFYHMLTGQPPVPDGTAAKKLHHHQHVLPVDPRQLNPEIPNEVAAILGRMMSKEPRDRYQRPVHLVHHLMQAVRKYDGAEGPEEGLWVDAPLPAAPRKRPLLLASLAALALASVLFLLSLAPSPNRPLPELPPGNGQGRERPPAPPSGTVPEPRPPVLVAPMAGPLVARSEKDLERMLAEAPDGSTIYLQGTIDLGEAGLKAAGGGRYLTLEARDSDEPATLVFKYVPGEDAAEPVAGLTMEDCHLTMRNLRLEIDAASTPEIPVATFALRKTGSARFHKCVFLQKNVPQRAFLRAKSRVVPIASVLVDNPGGTLRPRVIFEQCLFQGSGAAPLGSVAGQAAVALNGPAEVQMLDGTFKPHACLFHLRGDASTLPQVVKMARCAAFVVNGPALRIDDQARCQLQIERCVLSCPDNLALFHRDEPHLIRQTAATAPVVEFAGLRNCYHNLNALWVWPSESGGAVILTDLEEFRQQVVKANGKGDQDSSLLGSSVSPWAAKEPLREETAAAAFRLRPDLQEVRTLDLKKALGPERCAWGPIEPLPAWTTPETPGIAAKMKENEKVVDPDDLGSMPQRIFRTVFQALAFAQPGDVILIKHGKNSREVEVQPVRLDKPGIDLTFRPYPGHHPILTMAQTSEEDAALFRLQEGRLAFENLELQLEPDQVGFKSQAAVLVGGQGSISFRNCVLTLKPADRSFVSPKVPLNVVALSDLDETVKMMPRSSRPTTDVSLQDCFVRGEGNVVAARTARPVNLSVDNSLLGLAGSLLKVKGAPRDVTGDPSSTIRLRAVAAFLTEPLLAIQAGKNGRGLSPIRVERPRDSLFVSLGDRPLVFVESSDTSEDALRLILEWKGDRNAYCNYDRFLEVQRPDDVLPLQRLEQARWIEFGRESDSRYPRTPFILPPASLRSLWTAAPTLFRPATELQEELQFFGPSLDTDSMPPLAPARPAMPTELMGPLVP